MVILGIESSCDDTSVAIVKANESGFVVLSEKTASQIDIHKKYGGVVPEIAGRAHAENIIPLIESVMKGQGQPNVIAVTAGPGLMTGLLVGVEAAKSLSYLWNVPLVPTNHIEGHIHSVLLSEGKKMLKNEINFPALCLIVSGGHTELVLMKDHGVYELIGKTRDDAAGEAFDKVAKLLGYEYPGGPKISALAQKGNPQSISFPRPMIRDNNYDFSFAGLKTAALYWLRDNAKKQGAKYEMQDSTVHDFCASFEEAIVDVLVQKTMNAAKEFNPKTIILSGGVSANRKLQETLVVEIQKQYPSATFLMPVSPYTMDNAAMIAVASYWHALKKEYTPWYQVTTNPNWHVYDE